MDKNNFDGVRIGLALIVVFAHLSALTQLADFKPFESIFNSNFAVKGFFAISGFLVMKSYLTSNTIADYFERRVRRIYPAYLMAVLLCLFIGAFATSLNISAFFQSKTTLKYLLANATFLNFLQPSLPSTFEGNPMPALNGALWTIKVEVMLYFSIPVIFYTFTKFGSIKSSLIIFLFGVAWVYFFTFKFGGTKAEEIARQFPAQLSYFVIGSLLATNKKIFSNIKKIVIASLFLFVLLNNPYLKLFIQPIFYSVFVIYLSSAAFKNLNLGRYGDISYGIYLYHFPIIQLLIYLGIFKLNEWIGLCLTLIITISLALLSWHFVEKRFLKRNSHYLVVARN